MFINVNGTWKSITNMFVNVSGTWKRITDGFVNVAGTWKRFFSISVTPVIEQQVQLTKSSSINANYHNSTYPVTLTGTKYHFANASVFSYRFYRSSDQSTWTPITSETITTNPSSGSSSTVTHQLQNADFTSTTMYFKFEYTATNTTYNTTATSTSNIVSVIYLEIPSGSANLSQSTISVASTATSGTWSGSPTSFDWKWYYNVGGADQVLTYEATKSISNRSISGTVATISASSHGFKNSDFVTISGTDALFDGSFTINNVVTNVFNYSISKPEYSFPTPYVLNSYVTYSGNIYKATTAVPSGSAWSFSTNYTVGQYVTYNSNLYQASTATPSPRTNWNSSTNYTVGQYVNNGGQVWQSTSNLSGQTPFEGSDFWNLINIYPGGSYWTLINVYPGGSYWALQSGSYGSGGSATGPNYHEGVQSSPVTYTINSFPASDYKSGVLLKGHVTKFSLIVSNGIFTGSALTSRLIYGFPSIALQTATFPNSTSASIAYTQADMSVYDIDVKIGASSISGYPKTNQANSSPISITGLSSSTSYTAYVTPKNADSPRVSGNQQSLSFTTPAPPPNAFTYTISNVSFVTTPSTPTQTRVSSTSNDILFEFASSIPSNTLNYILNLSGPVTNAGNQTINIINLFSNNSEYQTTLTSSANNSAVSSYVVANGTTRSYQANVNTTTGAQSWRVNYTYTIGALSETDNINTNSMPVRIIDITGSTNPTVTINSITAYSGQNQTGTTTSGTAGSPTSLSNISRPTATSGTSTNNYTYFSPNLITNPAYGTATSTSGGWTASITTQPNPTGGTYSVISQTAGSASVNSSTGALTASGLTVGQSSTVTVRYSLSGYNPVDITANGSALSKLSTPTNVVASDNRTDGVNITWTAVSGAAYYGVWYGPPAPSYNSTPDFGGPSNPSLITGTSYLDTSLGSGVTRDYYVQAFRTNNPTGTKSEWSAGDSGTRVAASSTGATQISYVAPTTAAINVTTGSGTIPDDGYFTLNLPFNTFFNGTSYSQIFIGTNSYATFGGGSGTFSGLSASNPAFNKIMIAAADRGSTGIYFTSSASSWTMRYEGSSGTSGSPIATIWELQCLSSNPKSIRLSIVQVASGGFTGMCSSSSLINSLGGAGTSWNITSA